MAANTTPIFPLTPRNAQTRLSGSVQRDGVGAQAVFTAGVSGSVVESISWTNSASGSSATNAANVARVWLGDFGGNYKCVLEFLIPSVAGTTQVIGAAQTANFIIGQITPSGVQIGINTPLKMPSGSVLAVGQGTYSTNVDQFDVLVRGGDY